MEDSEKPPVSGGTIVKIKVGKNQGEVIGIQNIHNIQIDQLYLGQMPSEGHIVTCQESCKGEIGAILRKLKVGNVEELVGRQDALAWLKKHLLDRPAISVAVASVHGARGMGKTFLAHAFVDLHCREVVFRELYLGERSALDVGLEFLRSIGVKSDHIDSTERLQKTLKEVYARNAGILILDDVCKEDVQILLPNSLKWRVLITTRSQSLAGRLAEYVFRLDVLEESESLELFRKVLGKDYDAPKEEDYRKLAQYLGHRPYEIRLAADSLKDKLRYNSPGKLLQYLKTKVQGLPPLRPGYEEDQKQLLALRPLLEDCLSQLETRSAQSSKCLDYLAVCTEEGMKAQYFLEWQDNEALMVTKENEIHETSFVPRNLEFYNGLKSSEEPNPRLSSIVETLGAQTKKNIATNHTSNRAQKRAILKISVITLILLLCLLTITLYLLPSLPLRFEVYKRATVEEKWQNASDLNSWYYYKIHLHVSRKLYIYAFQKDSSGTIQPFFPKAPANMQFQYSFENPLYPGDYYIPPLESPGFILDDKKGKEDFYFLYSPKILQNALKILENHLNKEKIYPYIIHKNYKHESN